MHTFNSILEKRDIKPPLRYGISDRRVFGHLEPCEYLDLLFATGAHILQWREKDLCLEENRRCIRRGVQLAGKTGKLFLINTFFELAWDEGADGVHLTSVQNSGAGRIVPKRPSSRHFLIGKSAHTLAEAQKAAEEGVDYVILGPVFDPLSKEPTRPPLGVPTLREATRRLTVPVIAVGGIDGSNVQAVVETDVIGVAGISWVHGEVEALTRRH